MGRKREDTQSEDTEWITPWVGLVVLLALLAGALALAGTVSWIGWVAVAILLVTGDLLDRDLVSEPTSARAGALGVHRYRV